MKKCKVFYLQLQYKNIRITKSKDIPFELDAYNVCSANYLQTNIFKLF